MGVSESLMLEVVARQGVLPNLGSGWLIIGDGFKGRIIFNRSKNGVQYNG